MRVNEAIETYKHLNESRSRLAQKELDAIKEQIAMKEQFENNYHTMMDMRNRKKATRANLMEAARNDAFSTIVKAIYIGALEASTLTDEGIILAESMVDNWIKENGGASSILSKVGNKTYLLARITQLTEAAAEEAVEEIESGEPAEETETKSETKSSGKDKKETAIAAAVEFLKNARKSDVNDFMSQVFNAAKNEDEAKKEENAAKKAEKTTDKSVDPTDDDEPGEDEDQLKVPQVSEEESETDEEEDVEEKETTFEDDPDEEDVEDEEEVEDEESETDDEDLEDDDEEDLEEEHEDLADETDEELGEPLDDDGIDQDTTVDGGTENKGEIFNELEKEDDVVKAVELIRKRISDAEETFIKNNAEDKKKIDELLGRIANNVKTIESLNDKNGDKKAKEKAEVAEESVRVYKRYIDSIKENRPLTVFEKMSRNLSRNIIKDEVIRENYITESGSLDTDLIVESSKVMYGFLETLNTLQLEKVDSAYIKKVLESMK